LIYPTSKTYTIQLFHFSLNNKSIKKGLLRRRFYIIKNIHSPGREVSIYMAALRIDGYSFISPLWGFPPKTSIALHLLVVNLVKCFSDNLRPLIKAAVIVALILAFIVAEPCNLIRCSLNFVLCSSDLFNATYLILVIASSECLEPKREPATCKRLYSGLKKKGYNMFLFRRPTWRRFTILKDLQFKVRTTMFFFIALHIALIPLLNWVSMLTSE